MVNLQTDNISNKEDITEIKVEQELQNNNIEKIQLENKELKAENERLREDLKVLPSRTSKWRECNNK